MTTAAQPRDILNQRTTLALLVEGSVSIVTLDSDEKRLIQVRKHSLPGRPYSFAGLACGRLGTVLMHRTEQEPLDGSVKTSSSIVEMTLSSGNVSVIHESATELWTFPLLSERGDLIAGAVVERGRARAGIGLLETRTGRSRVLWQLDGAGPQSWSNQRLLLTVLSDNRSNWTAIELDPESNAIVELGPGGRPIRRGDNLATLSFDQRNILLRQKNGSGRVVAYGFFKNLVRWLDDERILFVTGWRFEDRVGIVDIANGDITIFAPSFRSEISGTCVLTSNG